MSSKSTPHGIINDADQVPGRDVYERYEELVKEVEELKILMK